MKPLHEIHEDIIVIPGSLIYDALNPYPARRLEVFGVKDRSDPETREEFGTMCEQLSPTWDGETPDFWTVYDHQSTPNDGFLDCEALSDHHTREEALEAARDKARETGFPVYDFTREGYR